MKDNQKNIFWYEEEKIVDQKLFEGPSLLDFFAECLSSGKFSELSQLNNSVSVENRKNSNEVENPKRTYLSWINILPFLFAFLGQVLLNNKIWLGFVLFFISIWGVMFLFSKHNLEIVPIFKADFKKDDLFFNLVPFIFAMILIIISFIFFSYNLFDWKNVLFWVFSLFFMILAFWVPQNNFDKIKLKLAKWRDLGFKIRFSKWSLLLFSSFVLIFFFRFFRLDSVLPEMISDHAEKLLDVLDVLNGKYSIFFTRNTGREPLQFYLIAFISKIFKTGISFLSMKIGTAFFGFLMCFYMYLFGKEVGNKWIGLFSALLTGVSFWGNVLARVALRFIFYPAFVAPTLFYFVRGIRKGSRNDFILAGIFLGIGLNGYSPIRVLPLLILIGFVLFLMHRSSKGMRYQVFVGFVLVTLFAMILFLPLGRYFIDNPHSFLYRQTTRMTSLETPIEGSVLKIFCQNVVDGFLMFNWNDGEIWVNSIPGRPLLDVFSATFFVVGLVIVFIRYLNFKNWMDLFLLFGLFILMLPSTLSVAYPAENPAPNRAGGAMVIVFYFASLGLYSFLKEVSFLFKQREKLSVTILCIVVVGMIALSNYRLMFIEHNTLYKNNSWNTSEMGDVLSDYLSTGVKAGDVHVIAYPYWVDGRLVAFNAGLAGLDLSYAVEDIPNLVFNENQQVFLLKPDHTYALELLQEFFPDGELKVFESFTPSKDFYIFTTY